MNNHNNLAISAIEEDLSAVMRNLAGMVKRRGATGIFKVYLREYREVRRDSLSSVVGAPAGARW